jgi:hypothetical protein
VLERALSRVRGWAVPYLCVQGLSVVAWWLLLFAHPPSRRLFFPGGELSPEMSALLLPDLVTLAGGSFAAAAARTLGRTWGAGATWLVAGAATYAALFTIHWSLLEGAPWLSPLLMSLAAAGSLSCARAPV